jgi:hypothetical protein
MDKLVNNEISVRMFSITLYLYTVKRLIKN